MDSDNLTVLKLIALAGGTTRTAKMNGVKIIRKGPNGMTETPVQLKKMLQAKVADIPMRADGHPVCPQQYQQSDHDPFRGRCGAGCGRRHRS